MVTHLMLTMRNVMFVSQQCHESDKFYKFIFSDVESLLLSWRHWGTDIRRVG